MPPLAKLGIEIGDPTAVPDVLYSESESGAAAEDRVVVPLPTRFSTRFPAVKAEAVETKPSNRADAPIGETCFGIEVPRERNFDRNGEYMMIEIA